MDTDIKLLKIVSNDTKNSISQLSIVTPSIYASIFSEVAKKNNVKFDNEEELSHDILGSEYLKLNALQEQTDKNVKNLSETTNKAIEAIAKKDDRLLEHILNETKALKKEIHMLKKSVYQDELTHTYNRKWLNDTCLGSEGENFLNNGTLAIIDLNYFKQINDTYGHIIGDKVLVFITNALKTLKVPVIRYGGDEFIILFGSKTTQKEATEFLNSIRDNVLSKKLKAQNNLFRVSFSFGVTTFETTEGFMQVVEKADKAMYQDKIKIKKRVTGI